MKKTYFSPVSRFIDLSIESGCCVGPGSLTVHGDEGDDVVTDPNDPTILTKNQSIWDNWKVDDN